MNNESRRSRQLNVRWSEVVDDPVNPGTALTVFEHYSKRQLIDHWKIRPLRWLIGLNQLRLSLPKSGLKCRIASTLFKSGNLTQEELANLGGRIVSRTTDDGKTDNI